MRYNLDDFLNTVYTQLRWGSLLKNKYITKMEARMWTISAQPALRGLERLLYRGN